MTIKEIRNLTDWRDTLQSRSVFAVMKHDATFELPPLRIIGVGTRYVSCLRNSGDVVYIEAENIDQIRGL